MRQVLSSPYLNQLWLWLNVLPKRYEVMAIFQHGYGGGLRYLSLVVWVHDKYWSAYESTFVDSGVSLQAAIDPSRSQFSTPRYHGLPVRYLSTYQF